MTPKAISQSIFIALAVGSFGSVAGCSAGDPGTPEAPPVPGDTLLVGASEEARLATGVNAWGITLDPSGSILATGYDDRDGVVTRLALNAEVGGASLRALELVVSFPESARGSVRLEYFEDRVEGEHNLIERPEGLAFAEWLQKDVASLDLSALDAPTASSLGLSALGFGSPIGFASDLTPGSGGLVDSSDTVLARRRRPRAPLVNPAGLCLVNESGRGCGGKLLATLGTCSATTLTCVGALAAQGGSAVCTVSTAGGCSFTIPVALLAGGACGASGVACAGNILNLHDEGCKVVSC